MAQSHEDFDSFSDGSRHVAQIEYTSSPSSPDLRQPPPYHPRPSDEFTPPKKRSANSEKEKKKRNYDVLGAFFNVYFCLDPTSSVLKGAVWSLYQKKVDEEYRIPRNAMYRNMWQKFGKNIQPIQSKYRDLVRGLKLFDSPAHIEAEPERYAPDQRLLEEHGIVDLFDFTQEDLIPKATESTASPGSSACSSPVPFSHPKASFDLPFPLRQGNSNDDLRDVLLSNLQNLETHVKMLTQSIIEMRAQVEKHLPERDSISPMAMEDEESST